ncbi:MAG: hypothetical protein K5872_04615 [Rhizobiaceae bacterium]|nr:hypothetical protein [Rhizobiaceae bacterium]MCV0405493.1 hypothetical protein [Rhizobiaceae bacterium]
MTMGKSAQNREEAASADANEVTFNETLKRMLKTPPKPHEKASTKSLIIKKPVKKVPPKGDKR